MKLWQHLIANCFQFEKSRDQLEMKRAKLWSNAAAGLANFQALH